MTTSHRGLLVLATLKLGVCAFALAVAFLITDGLGVYIGYAAARPQISHGSCMRHARLKFADAIKAKKGKPPLAKWRYLL